MSIKIRKDLNWGPFGSGLVHFMWGMIVLISDLSGTVRVQKRKGAYYLPSHLYAVCNFDISLLPIRLNLPMVCRPQDWQSISPPGEYPKIMSDLSGGYLSCPTGEIYDRYHLCCTGDIQNFLIFIGEKEENDKYLCSVMNKLQHQAYQINSYWLNYISENVPLSYSLSEREWSVARALVLSVES